MVLLLRGLNHVFHDQVSDLEFSNLHLLVVCCPDLLLVSCDTDLCMLSLFFRLIQYQAELGVILVLIYSFNSECRHADVDWDDRLYLICQRERGFAVETRLVVL